MHTTRSVRKCGLKAKANGGVPGWVREVKSSSTCFFNFFALKPKLIVLHRNINAYIYI
jgi:hypothetical protein